MMSGFVRALLLVAGLQGVVMAQVHWISTVVRHAEWTKRALWAKTHGLTRSRKM